MDVNWSGKRSTRARCTLKAALPPQSGCAQYAECHHPALPAPPQKVHTSSVSPGDLHAEQLLPSQHEGQEFRDVERQRRCCVRCAEEGAQTSLHSTHCIAIAGLSFFHLTAPLSMFARTMM